LAHWITRSLFLTCVAGVSILTGCVSDTRGVAAKMLAEPAFKTYWTSADNSTTKNALIDAGKATSMGLANVAEVGAATDTQVTFDVVQVVPVGTTKWGVIVASLAPEAGGTRCDFRIDTINGNPHLRGQLQRWPELIWSNVKLKLGSDSFR
jgi:hypothetical protein